jgi:hypothetical protein
MELAQPKIREPYAFFTDEQLAKLRAAYEDKSIPLKQLEYDFSTSKSCICRMARLNGWPRRMSSEGIARIANGLRIRRAAVMGAR